MKTGSFISPLMIAGMLVLGCGISVGQDGSGSARAGRNLWEDFLKEYAANSLQPLPPAELDAKAREALLEISGVRFRSWKPDAKASLPELAEAMSETDPSKPPFTRIEDVLEHLLPRIDRYGHYHRAADVSRLAEALRQNPGGLHMTLDRMPDGRTGCYPLDGGPAAEAGVGNGAILLAVDGLPVKGKSLPALRLMFVGPPGSEIRVKVAQPHGKIEEFAIRRSGTPVPTVIVEDSPLGLGLRIRKFDGEVAAKVKAVAETHPSVKRLTLDLRGNPGGLLNEVLKVESLFFPEGAVLGKWTDKTGEHVARDGNGVMFAPDSIRILQDERTASAAEFLIATLREGLPGKVGVFGKKSYGKSHSTIEISLDGGGQLGVTDALLATAGGVSWDRSGIEPDLARKAEKPAAAGE